MPVEIIAKNGKTCERMDGLRTVREKHHLGRLLHLADVFDVSKDPRVLPLNLLRRKAAPPIRTVGRDVR